MRAYLSGEPECKFGLNDKIVLEKRWVPMHWLTFILANSLRSERGSAGDNAVELDDCQFHQCVRLTQFDVDRTISFIPPDGEFELMRCVTRTSLMMPPSYSSVASCADFDSYNGFQ